jgi:chromosome segregation ATPase
LLLVVSVLLNRHLWMTTDDWEARSVALTDVNYELGEQLSREQQTTTQLESEIDLLSQQLATSNQRVVDLSASKASAEDESEYATQQIDQLTTSLSNASGVANALHRCVDGQQQLVTYLETPDNYEPEELADYAESVDQLCNAAERSSEQLREALAE